MPGELDDISKGKFLNEMINQGLSSFVPDLALTHMMQNFKNAKNLYGETLIREATGHSPDYIERNIKLPEFTRQLKSKLSAKCKELQEDGLLSDKGEILDKGVKFASVSLYIDELDHLKPQGLLGEHPAKNLSHYGTRAEVVAYKKGDRYKNIATKQTLKLAARRGHTTIHKEDLRIFRRHAKGEICIIYGIDASGSMRGKKIEVAKKAGVALAYKATQNNDKVGLMVFASEVIKSVAPTTNLSEIVDALTTITASKQTDIAKTIQECIRIFPSKHMTKHLILLTDAESTIGEDPKKQAISAAGIAQANNISISIVGIKLDETTATFARQLTEIGKGKLYLVSDTSQVDSVILHDYDSIAFS
jgi:Mg-chelatase subunit ChlD